MTTYSTAAAGKYTFGYACGNYTIDYPAGVRCKPIPGEPGKFWVDDLSWLPAGSLELLDATHHGIRVDAANITVTGAEPDVTPAAPVAVEKPAESLWLEVSAVRFGDGFAETCNDDPLSAHGFGVYMRNPLALHLIDFTPASVNPDKRVTLRECHLAAFRYAGALAEHMGADVRTTLNAGPLSYPSRFAIVPQRDFYANIQTVEGTNFDRCDEEKATQWAVFESMVNPNGFPDADDSTLVEDYPSREAAQAAIDALERGEPLPTPVWPPKRDVLPASMSFFVAAVSTDDGVEMSDVIWSDVEPNREALLKELSCYPQMSDADPEKVTFYGPFTVGGGAF